MSYRYVDTFFIGEGRKYQNSVNKVHKCILLLPKQASNSKVKEKEIPLFSLS